MMGGLFVTRHWPRASILLDGDWGRSLWGSRTDLHLRTRCPDSNSQQSSGPASWDGGVLPECHACAWTSDTRQHDDLSLSIRHNYVEGTKMLAAYLYEVSQLKD